MKPRTKDYLVALAVLAAGLTFFIVLYWSRFFSNE